MQSRVLDVGAGWCGPADLLSSERDANVVALTVSQAQSFYCLSHGHRSVHADAETLSLVDTFGYDSFDVSFLLESLEHISNKRALLSRLRDVSSKLLIRTGCLKSSDVSVKMEFDNSMYVESCESILSYVKESGWILEDVQYRESEVLPTHEEWRNRLLSLPSSLNREDNVIGAMVRAFNTTIPAGSPGSWFESHSLMEVVARRPEVCCLCLFSRCWRTSLSHSLSLSYHTHTHTKTNKQIHIRSS